MYSGQRTGGPDPEGLIRRYAPPGGEGLAVLWDHACRVADKAVAVARRLGLADPEVRFIREAALLHDIGVFKTHAPEIGCHGEYPYIAHGYLGRSILEDHQMPRHALVCERHVGVGLSRAEIEAQNLPLPLRDMTPVSLAEEIVAYADQFFSKSRRWRGKEKSVPEILIYLGRFGPEKAARFEGWLRRFGNPGIG